MPQDQKQPRTKPGGSVTLHLDKQPGPQALSQLPRGQKQTNSTTPWGTGHLAGHDSSDYHPPVRHHLEEARLQGCNAELSSHRKATHPSKPMNLPTDPLLGCLLLRKQLH